MSFILDALKKLEQQRQRGSMPDLTTVHVAEPRRYRKRPLWFYLVFAALLLNAGILALFFISRDTEKVISPVKSPVEHLNKQALGGQAPPLPEKSSEPAETTSSGGHKITTRKPDGRSDGGEKQNQRSMQVRQIEQKPVRKRHSVSPSDTDTHANINIQKDSKLRPQSSSNTLSSAPPSAPPVFHQSDPPKTGNQEDIPELSQLPQSVRSEIPSIIIFGHIYSNNAATRMVNINGDILREGDTVSKNIKVKKITENGVIFAYGDILFRIRAF